MCYKSDSSTDQKGSTSVSQSSQTKTLVMVPQSSEGVEEALSCVKVERPRYEGNFKKIIASNKTLARRDVKIKWERY